MTRRIVIALIAVWLGLHVIWLLTWLLGVGHPVPRVLGGVVGVLDIIVVIIIAVHLARGSWKPQPDAEEE